MGRIMTENNFTMGKVKELQCADSTCARTHWRGEVTTNGDDTWYTNALRFHTREDALDYVRGLAVRWTLVSRWRAVDDSVPRNQVYEPGSEDGAW